MSLIGVRRFIALLAKLQIAFALVGASAAVFGASACPVPPLNHADTIARFNELDKQAQAAMQQHPNIAARLYKEAICLVPDSPRGFYGLGMAQSAAGNFADARASFQTADRLQPTSVMPLLMQVRVNFSLNDMDALKANLREISVRFPRDERAHTTLARFFAEKNLFVLALAEALRAERAAGADPASKVQLAVLENMVGAYDDALGNAIPAERDPELQKAVRASAAGVAGLSYESLGETDEAIQHLKAAIELDPSRDNSYLALADLYEQSQKYPDAVDVLTQARLHFGDSPAILLPLGTNLIRTEHYAGGIQILRDLLHRNPNLDEAYIGLADAARRMGNADQEVAALRGLEVHNPSYPMLHVLIARAMLNNEHPDYSSVLHELSLAAKSAPADPDIFYLKGKALIALKRYEEAAANLRRSIELRPMEPSPYYQLAKLYQKLGDNDLARKQFEKVKYLESANGN